MQLQSWAPAPECSVGITLALGQPKCPGWAGRGIAPCWSTSSLLPCTHQQQSPIGRDHLEEQKIKEATVDPDYSHPDNPWMDEVPDFIDSWNPDRPPVELHAQLATLAKNPGADIGLPVRYLGHAPLVHYYWLFHSHWDSLHAYCTFAHEKTFEDGVQLFWCLGVQLCRCIAMP